MTKKVAESRRAEAQTKRRMEFMEKQLVYVDYRILKLLPKVGTRVGLKEVAVPVKQIVKQLESEGANWQMIGGRIRSLSARKYAVAVPLFSQGIDRGYQITEKGEEAVRGYENKHEESTS